MEQTECECPCECPLDYYEDEPRDPTCRRMDRISGTGRKPTPQSVPLCSPLPEDLISMNALNYESEFELKSCTNINCEDYTTQSECLGMFIQLRKFRIFRFICYFFFLRTCWMRVVPSGHRWRKYIDDTLLHITIDMLQWDFRIGHSLRRCYKQ